MWVMPVVQTKLHWLVPPQRHHVGVHNIRTKMRVLRAALVPAAIASTECFTSPPPYRKNSGKRSRLLTFCFNGREVNGGKASKTLLKALLEPWFNRMSIVPYPVGQSMFDGLYPKGMQWYWRGDFVKTLLDTAITVTIRRRPSWRMSAMRDVDRDVDPG